MCVKTAHYLSFNKMARVDTISTRASDSTNMFKECNKMSGYKIMMCMPGDAYLWGMIDYDSSRPAATYDQFLTEDDFIETFGRGGFSSVRPFAMYDFRDRGLRGVLEFISEATQYCINLAGMLWEEIKVADMPDNWYLTDSCYVSNVRMLMRTTCATLRGILLCGGLDAEIIEYTMNSSNPYAVRIDNLEEEGDYRLGVCPTSFLSPEVPNWVLPSKLYYYESDKLGLKLQDTNDITKVIHEFQVSPAQTQLPQGSAVAAPSKNMDFNGTPHWILVSELGGHATEWEIRMFHNTVLGAYSAKALWMEDDKQGSVSIYREFVYVCDVSVDASTYHDEDTFKKAAWDAITGHMSVAAQALKSRLEAIMQSYPTD